jgi:hypothetical protein
MDTKLKLDAEKEHLAQSLIDLEKFLKKEKEEQEERKEFREGVERDFWKFHDGY